MTSERDIKNLETELRKSAERRRKYKEVGAYEQEAREISIYHKLVEKIERDKNER